MYSLTDVKCREILRKKSLVLICFLMHLEKNRVTEGNLLRFPYRKGGSKRSVQENRNYGGRSLVFLH